MANITALLGGVTPLVVKAPAAVITTAFIKAARRFYTETKVWRESVPNLVTVAGDPVVSLASVLTGSEAFDIESCKVGEATMVKTTPEKGLALPVMTSPGYVALTKINELTLFGPPSADDVAITLRAILRPSFDAAVFPGEQYDAYGDFLDYGTLTTLMRQPNQPWSDPEGAGLYEALFADAINSLRHAGSAGTASAPNRVAYGGL